MVHLFYLAIGARKLRLRPRKKTSQSRTLVRDLPFNLQDLIAHLRRSLILLPILSSRSEGVGVVLALLHKIQLSIAAYVPHNRATIVKSFGF